MSKDEDIKTKMCGGLNRLWKSNRLKWFGKFGKFGNFGNFGSWRVLNSLKAWEVWIDFRV